MGRTIVLFCALAMTSTVGNAQSHSLTGTWAVSAQAARGETENGGTWSLSASEGVLTLDQRDAALTGSWRGAVGEPWSVTGRVQSGKFDLRTEMRDAPARRNNEKTTVSMRWIFRGSVAGDEINGTMTVENSSGAMRSQPFTASRKR